IDRAGNNGDGPPSTDKRIVEWAIIAILRVALRQAFAYWAAVYALARGGGIKRALERHLTKSCIRAAARCSVSGGGAAKPARQAEWPRWDRGLACARSCARSVCPRW